MRQSAASSGRSSPRRLWTPALTALLPAGGLAGVLILCTPPLVELPDRVAADGWRTIPFELLLTSLAAAALAACGLWLATVTLATVVEAVTGVSSVLLRALTPAVVHRAVLLSCGLVVGGAGALSPAAADPHSGGAEEAAARRPPITAGVLIGLPLPDRTVGGSFSATAPSVARETRRTTRTAAASAARATLGRHRVTPGESLWSIAADLLPARASEAEVDTAWRRIYRTNRTVVGTDPDLIHPGTTLRLPSATWPPTSDPRQGVEGPGPTTP